MSPFMLLLCSAVVIYEKCKGEGQIERTSLLPGASFKLAHYPVFSRSFTWEGFRYNSYAERSRDMISRCGLGLSGVMLLAALAVAGEREVANFALLDATGKLHELRRQEGKAVVLFFTANGCPVARQSAPKLNGLAQRFGDRGVTFF